MSKRKLFYALPASVRLLARQLYYLPTDLWDKLSNQRTEMVPPKGKIYTGGGNFKETGNRFLDYFIKYGNLSENGIVLDIGSGIGRMAIPLTTYLSPKGIYKGFDVVKIGVDWCKKEITSRFQNFEFKYINLSNDLYKNSGDDATQFKFPYAPSQFDLTILISVFTHMSLEEVLHYLDEIHTVLKPGGKCFATFFTYDKTPNPVRTDFDFSFKYDAYALMDNKVKSANIAFDFSFLKEQIEGKGFKIETYNKGEWQVSDDESLDFQDVIVFTKV